MGKHKNLIVFLLITLLRSIFLGMVKIFLRSALKEDHRTLEEIAGYLSIGFGLAYIVGGGLVYSVRKKYITIFAGIGIIVCLVWGFLTDYFPFKNFATLLMIMGFFTGLWLTVKGVIITMEILKSKRSETTINAMVNITILIGILIGSYRGFGAYSWLKEVGFIAIAGLLLIATILTGFLNYDQEPIKHTLYSAVSKNIPNIIQSIKRYYWILIPIAIGRGISTGIIQKTMEIGLQKGNQSHNGVIIIICAMIGTIIGNLIGTKYFHHKHKSSNILTAILAISILCVPLILQLPHMFIWMNIYNIYLGIIFGIIINIREARFYHIIGDDNRKEFGSAAYGIINSILIFGIMLTTNAISNHTGNWGAFIFFAICTLLCLPFIQRLK